MDARGIRHVFAQELDSICHHHKTVECGASHLGRGRGVGRLAVETELGGSDGERALFGCHVGIAGMPAQDGVDILEQAGADHVQLSAAAFFGGRAVEADGALDFLFGHPVLDGDRGEEGSGS